MASRSRFISRVGALCTILVFVFVLFYTFEPKKTAYSCRTLQDCLGKNHHSYQHKLPTEPIVSAKEVTLRDGTLRFDRTIQDVNPDTLILVLTRDTTSWSKDFRSTRRTAYDLLDLLVSTNLNLTTVSLALMTASPDEYNNLVTATSTLPLGRTTILYRPDTTGPQIPYLERHRPSVQTTRRAYIATLRNHLMLRTLSDETHIIYLDADVVSFSPPDMIQIMQSHSTSTTDAGIITARCTQNRMENYDRNAWVINRNVPLIMDPVSDAARDVVADKLASTRRYMTEVLRGSHDHQLVPLDSVGGTILYIRADLVRDGVHFPSFNLVGTTWRHDGWSGLETEGICYMAERVRGKSMCFALGGMMHVRHSDVG